MAKRKKAPSRAETKNRLVAAADALSLPGRFDVAVVGGGASGLVAAIAAAEAGARTVVLERSLECGKKILATGNDRGAGRVPFQRPGVCSRHLRKERFLALGRARVLEVVRPRLDERRRSALPPLAPSGERAERLAAPRRERGRRPRDRP